MLLAYTAKILLLTLVFHKELFCCVVTITASQTWWTGTEVQPYSRCLQRTWRVITVHRRAWKSLTRFARSFHCLIWKHDFSIACRLISCSSWSDCCKNSNALWVSISSRKLMACFLQDFTILCEGVISSRWSREVADVIKSDSVVCRGQGLVVWTPARTRGGFRLPISSVQVPISFPSLQLSSNKWCASLWRSTITSTQAGSKRTTHCTQDHTNSSTLPYIQFHLEYNHL